MLLELMTVDSMIAIMNKVAAAACSSPPFELAAAVGGNSEFKHTRQNFAVAYFVICDVSRFVSRMSQTTNLAIGRQFVVMQSAFLRQSTLLPTPLCCDLRPQY